MNSQENNSNVEAHRAAVRQAFRKVVPNPTFETTWWKNLFGDHTQAESNIEMSVHKHRTNAAA